MRLQTFMLFFLLFFGANFHANAQTPFNYTWTLINAGGVNPTGSATGVSASAVTRGSAAPAPNASGIAMLAPPATVNSYLTAMNNGYYIEFTLTPNSIDWTLTFPNSASGQLSIHITNPGGGGSNGTTVGVYYSTDNWVNQTQLASNVNFVNGTASTVYNFQPTASVSKNIPVKFRVYFWNSGGTGRQLTLSNLVSRGTITAPLPDCQRLSNLVSNATVQTITIYGKNSGATENLTGANPTLKLLDQTDFIDFTGALTVNRALTIQAGTGETITLNAPAHANTRHFTVSGASGNLTLKDLILDGKNTSGGIDVSVSTASLTVNNAVIKNCVNTGNGGAIHALGGLTLNPVSITNCKAKNGGGIYTQTALSLTNATISNNMATGEGGGIWAYPLNLTLGSNVLFSGNTAKAPFWLENEDPTYTYQGVTVADMMARKTNNLVIPGSLSASPAGTAPFTHAYNNYDVNFRGELFYHIWNWADLAYINVLIGNEETNTSPKLSDYSKFILMQDLGVPNSHPANYGNGTNCPYVGDRKYGWYGYENQAGNANGPNNSLIVGDNLANIPQAWHPTEGWIPIGWHFHSLRIWRPFVGNFDGQGFTVNGLWINRPGADDQGLFGYVNGGTLKNIGVNALEIKGEGKIAVLVGNLASMTGFGENSIIRGHTSITNCYATGTVMGTGQNSGSVGILSGISFYTDYTDCYAAGTVSALAYSGLICGQTYFAKAIRCYAVGNINGTVPTSSTIGGLFGWFEGDFEGDTALISECYANVNITAGGNRLGGLAAYLDVGRIENSYATGTVNGGGDYIGGLVGQVRDDSAIENCFATGAVSGGNMVGGLVGHIRNDNVLKNSFAFNPSVSGTGANVGRIAGIRFSTVLSGNSALECMEVKINGSRIDPAASGKVHGDSIHGANVTLANALLQNTYSNSPTLWDFTNTWLHSPYNSNYNIATGAKPTNLPILRVFDKNSNNGYFAGAVQPPHVMCKPEYHIWNWADLAFLNTLIDNEKINTSPKLSDYSKFVLMQDLGVPGSNPANYGNGTNCPYAGDRKYGWYGYENQAGNAPGPNNSLIVGNNLDQIYQPWHQTEGWKPVAANNPFTGIFDGNNNAVNGLWIKRTLSSTYAQGLFVNAKNATIQNLGVNFPDSIIAYRSAAGLVTFADFTTISNCYTTGVIRILGSGDGGGLVSNLKSGVINNSYSTCDLINKDNNSSFFGGLVAVASNSTRISNSYATGNISFGSIGGGLVGNIFTMLIDAHNPQPDDHLKATHIDNCYATGNVTGDVVGGLVGEGQAVRITNSYATGNITGDRFAGGLSGNFYVNGSEVKNSYATGSITGNNYVGGLVGAGYFDGKISNSFALNPVITALSSTTNVGRIIGSPHESSTNGTTLLSNNRALDCMEVWINGTKQTSLSPTPAQNNIHGLNVDLTQATTQSTYTTAPQDWNFANTWLHSPYNANYKTVAGAKETNLPILRTFDMNSNNGFFANAAQPPHVACAPPNIYEVWNWADLAYINVLIANEKINTNPKLSDYDKFALMQDLGVPNSHPANYGDGNNCPYAGDRKYGWYGYENQAGNAPGPNNSLIVGNNLDHIYQPWHQTEGWKPVGTGWVAHPGIGAYSGFIGVFDGQGFVVSGLWIDRLYNTDQGLFGYVVMPATIKNLGVVIGEKGIRATGRTGALVGNATHNTAKNDDLLIENCHASGGGIHFRGGTDVGGLIGLALHGQQATAGRIDITGCYSTVDITDENYGTYAGSLAGYASSRINSVYISDCYATGNLTVEGSPGGLIGYLDGATLKNSYATGNVSATTSAGGLVSEANNSVISNCYATGNVSAESKGGLTGRRAGGLVGLLMGTVSISECYATGAVFGNLNAGGLAGQLHNSSVALSLKNSFAFNPSVKGNADVGRVLGNASGASLANFTNNHALECMEVWIGNNRIDPIAPVKIHGDSIHGADVTLLNAMLQNTYSNSPKSWDFTNTWIHSPYNSNYNVATGAKPTNLPILRVFDKNSNNGFFANAAQPPHVKCASCGSDWERLRGVINTYSTVDTFTLLRKSSIIPENYAAGLFKLCEHEDFINSSGTPIDITRTVVIQSFGKAPITLYAPDVVNANKRHFTVSLNGNFTLAGIVLDGSLEGSNLATNANPTPSGGGITANGTLTLKNVTAQNCYTIAQSTGGGGGIIAYRNLILKDTININNNISTENGGGLYANINGNADLTGLTSLTLNGNEAVQNGGAIYATTTSLVFPSHCKVSITNNKAERFGGGLYARKLVLDGEVTISHNTSGRTGTVQNPELWRDGRGGGIDCNDSLILKGKVSVTHNTVIGGAGGGISAFPLMTVEGEIDISHNKAFNGYQYDNWDNSLTFYPGTGGGIRFNTDSDMLDSLKTLPGLISLNISHNEADSCGGGIYLRRGFLSLKHGNITIANNKSGTDGGAIYSPQPLNLTIGNNVAFSGNTAANAYLLSGAYNGTYLDATHAAIFARCTTNLVAPSSISLSSPFQYAYNNYDVNYVGGSPCLLPFEIWNWADLAYLNVLIENGKTNKSPKLSDYSQFVLMQDLGVPGQNNYGTGIATAKNGNRVCTYTPAERRNGYYGYQNFTGNNPSAFNSATIYNNILGVGGIITAADTIPSNALPWNADGWKPLGSAKGVYWSNGNHYPNAFYGIFDGQGFEISGLWINQTISGTFDNDGQGLFGFVDNDDYYSEIRNLGIVDANMTGHTIVGTLAGWMQGHVSNCYATGTVSAVGADGIYDDKGYVNAAGGLVAVLNAYSDDTKYGIISNCYAKVEVSVEGVDVFTVGGLVGRANDYTQVQNSYATGNVTVNAGDIAHSIAGLVGRFNDGWAENCYTTGNVTVTGNRSGYIGGFAGRWNTASTANHAINCYATGHVSVSGQMACVGGFFGYMYGGANGGFMEDCYATGNVTAPNCDYVGGFAGLITQGGGWLRRCFAGGAVIGKNHVGGLAGVVAQNSKIQNCFAFGARVVASGTNFGRIVGDGGYNTDPATTLLSNNRALECMEVWVNGNCVTPIASIKIHGDSIHGADVTLANALLQNTYSNSPSSWDFTNTWIHSPYSSNYNVVTSGATPTNLPILRAFDINANGGFFANALQPPFARCIYFSTKDTTICEGHSVNLSVLTFSENVMNPIYKWYAKIDDTTPLPSSVVKPGVGNTTYYASLSGDGLSEGPPDATGRKTIKITVDPTVVPAVIISVTPDD